MDRVRLTDSWNCGDDLAEFQLVQNGGLSGSVKTNLYGEV
jgi:hypothetical protein